MTTSLEIARAAYREVSLYSGEAVACEIDLSDNTNLWGTPPAALRAIREMADVGVTRYPSAYALALKDAIGTYTGVDASRVVTGCGSDDVLDSAIRALAEPGERLALCAPTFSMIPLFARLNGVEPVAVPATSSWDIDSDALAATGARIIYVCSPNNPTGTRASRAAFERLLERAPGIVIFDAAYAEFADDDLLDLAMSHERVVVVRTMSKAFGLAGLRVGYAIAAPSVAIEVEKSRGPYKVSATAERAAVAAFGDARGWVAERVAEARASRVWLTVALGTLGLTPLPSQANFVLVPVTDASGVSRRMRERGVAVRAFDALPGVGDALRITAGPPAIMERAIAVLEEALACA
jgi:histidinol-phosphate aminotransferase